MTERGVRVRLFQGLVAASALLASPLAAQAPGSEEASARWMAEQGGAWSVLRPSGLERVTLIHGRSERAPRASAPSEAELARLALEEVVRARELHGVDPATLVPGRVILLPLAQAGSTDKWAIELHQRLDGVPVEEGTVHLLLDAEGRLLALEARALRGHSRLERPEPALAAAAAAERALELFHADTGLAGRLSSAPRALVLREARGGREEPRLAWQVEVEASAENELAGQGYFLDAHEGTLLRREERVLAFDVSGTVLSMVSPRAWPDVPEAPEVLVPMARLEVQAGTVSVLTDEAGNFTIPGLFASPASPLTIRLRYSGTYAASNDSGMPDYELTLPLTASSGNRVVMNRNASPRATAEANAYHWITHAREWLRRANPLDMAWEFQIPAVVNTTFGPMCGATFNGSLLRFRGESSTCGSISVQGPTEFSCYSPIPGPPTLCTNKANASVVVHELGHWLNGIYSGVGGNTGFNEGAADAWAFYVTDQPLLAPMPCDTRKCWRNGENLLQFCGDASPSCYADPHEDGKVLGGALWKVRAGLKASLGDDLGRLAADTLFSSWMLAFSDNAIHSIVQLHWLLLDDDDANLANGTPNFAAIRGGFATQGFPPP